MIVPWFMGHVLHRALTPVKTSQLKTSTHTEALLINGNKIKLAKSLPTERGGKGQGGKKQGKPTEDQKIEKILLKPAGFEES